MPTFDVDASPEFNFPDGGTWEPSSGRANPGYYRDVPVRAPDEPSGPVRQVVIPDPDGVYTVVWGAIGWSVKQLVDGEFVVVAEGSAPCYRLELVPPSDDHY